jgi:hypothetical protein
VHSFCSIFSLPFPDFVGDKIDEKQGLKGLRTLMRIGEVTLFETLGF